MKKHHVHYIDIDTYIAIPSHFIPILPTFWKWVKLCSHPWWSPLEYSHNLSINMYYIDTDIDIDIDIDIHTYITAMKSHFISIIPIFWCLISIFSRWRLPRQRNLAPGSPGVWLCSVAMARDRRRLVFWGKKLWQNGGFHGKIREKMEVSIFLMGTSSINRGFSGGNTRFHVV